MPCARIGSVAAALAAGVAAACVLLVGPQVATAAVSTGSVTMVGEPGDWLSQSRIDLFDPSNGEVDLSGTLTHAIAGASGGAYGTGYGFEFAPPDGQTLAPGVYTKAQSVYGNRAAGRPGLSISGDGRSCDTNDGTFVVKDVHADSAGNLDRLWVLYEYHCGYVAGPALFGEIRLGEPAPGPAASAEPASVRWPNEDPGRPTQVLPVTVVAGSAGQQVVSASVAGASPEEFSVRLDQCSGETLAPGARCQVFVKFNPVGPGDHAADLVLTNADGSVVDVPLSGFVFPGTSRLDLQSDPGDFIGGGLYAFYTTYDAAISASGTRENVTMYVDGVDGSYTSASFSPASGDILTQGTTYTPTSPDGRVDGGPQFAVDGNHRGCDLISGHFTVLDAHFDANGALTDFGVSFVQHCDTGATALRGTIQFRSPTPAPLLAVNTAPPSVSVGTPVVGQTLEASPGTWNDPATAYAYQWQRCPWNKPCVDIPGATGQRYTVTGDDVFSQIAVEVNLTNPVGQSSWIRSKETDMVPEAAPPGPTPPATTPTTPTPAKIVSTPPAVTPPATITLGQTLAVPSRQPRRAVVRDGLRLTVGCSAACTVSVSVTGNQKGAHLGSRRMELPQGRPVALHLRLRPGSARRLTVTSTARLLAAPHTPAPAQHRGVTLD
jgi:hypothetical protein